MRTNYFYYFLLLIISCKSYSDTKEDVLNGQVEVEQMLDLTEGFQLKELPDSVLGKQYKIIDLGLNNAFDDASELLDSQNNLQVFVANFNEFKKWPLQQVHQGIRNISLQGNLLDSIHPSFCSYDSLTYLNLKENKFVSLPECLWLLPSLKDVNISFNYITTVKPINPTGGIENLDLQSNEITEVSAGLFKLPKLRYLNLADNKLTSIPIDSLPAQLEKLVLAGNPIPEKEKKRIIEKMDPEIMKIYW